MKPGYQTSEFWITLLSQLLSFLVAIHAISSHDEQLLASPIANAIAAIFTIIATAKVVIHYVQSRTALKQQQLGRGPSVPAILLPLVLLLVLSAPALAAPPVQSTCLLPWRQRVEEALRNRPDRAGDPATQQLLQQILENQRTILEMLQQQQRSPQLATPPAAAAPQVIVLGQPLQQIPLGGMPYQQIPLGGPPRQDIPLGGMPRQDVPLGAPPKQEIPMGAPPRQQLDVPTNPSAPRPQLTPESPPRQQIAPGAAPAPLVPPIGTRYRARDGHR